MEPAAGGYACGIWEEYADDGTGVAAALRFKRPRVLLASLGVCQDAAGRW